MTTLSDLASLPTPAVIESLSFETIFEELQTEFQSRYPDYSALLASDPAVKLLEVAAYREVLLRNRINAAAKASLLAFATGSDLDHLAAFYGVERLMGENDDALRLRTRQPHHDHPAAPAAGHQPRQADESGLSRGREHRLRPIRDHHGGTGIGPHRQ